MDSADPSDTGTCTTSSRSKVTKLTNWKRFANIPDSVNITGIVQAVQWCDYVVLLDDKNTIYLYHLKWGIWSSMNSINLRTAAGGCPLGIFRKELIMIASGGSGIYTFSMETGHWMPHKSLNTTFAGTANQVILATTSDQQSLLLLFQTAKKELYLRQYSGSSWSKAEQLKTAFLGSVGIKVSYAIVKANLCVYTGSNKVYIVHTQLKEGVKVMVTDVNLPRSLTMSTICGVNDTLFSFGGRDIDNQPSSDIYRYNPDTKNWQPAGYMRSCRFSVIISPFIRDSKNETEVFVIGGYFGGTTTPNTLLTCRIAETCEVSSSDD